MYRYICISCGAERYSSAMDDKLCERCGGKTRIMDPKPESAVERSRKVIDHIHQFHGSGKILDMLAKQIPERPSDIYEDIDGISGRCHSCRSRVMITQKFCSDCGQAADWTGVG